MSTKKTPRGVILLLVLAMLTLFALMALAFMYSTRLSWRMADNMAKSDEVVETSAVEIGASDAHVAILEVLRGSNSTVIGPHGILENLYGQPNEGGTDPLHRTINGVVPLASIPDDLIPLGAEGLTNNELICISVDKMNVEQLDLAGNVLTITGVGNSQTSNKKLVNQSTRIIAKKRCFAKNATDKDYLLMLILPFSWMDKNNPTGELVGCNFRVNGAPYSGTGAGYYAAQPWLPQLTMTDTDGVELTLRPNALAPAANPTTTPTTADVVASYLDYFKNTFVRMNIDYTAPDMKNMFLGWYELDPTASPTVKSVTPSFHRPRLFTSLNLLGVSGAETTATRIARQDMLRKMCLRPLPFDHPGFSGGSSHWQGFTAASDWREADTDLNSLHTLLARTDPQYYDVDNDGDGTKDGIWLDYGAGVRTDKDGKTYKPLMSVTVLDLDGRANVNVHGNNTQAESMREFGTYDGTDPILYTDQSLDVSSGSVGSSVKRGAGYGPAAVRLEKALKMLIPSTSSLSSADALLRLLAGDIANGTYPGRYILKDGAINLNNAKPGVADGYEPLGSSQTRYWNELYFPYFPVEEERLDRITAFGGAPPDLWDTSSVAFDYLGQKTFEPYSWGYTNGLWNAAGAPRPLLDNPYEFDPYNANNSDQPFTPAEFEGLLRPTDTGHETLAKRLRTLLFDDPSSTTSDTMLADKGKYFLTTLSNDIPLPNRRMNDQPGIYSLISRYVEDQYIRTAVTLQTAAETPQPNPALNLSQYKSNQGPNGNYGVEGTPYEKITASDPLAARKALSVDLEIIIAPTVEKLISILPEEIRNGEKIDLNKLTTRPSWIDPASDSTLTAVQQDALRRQGLRERADLARGIYLFLMVLSYEQLYGVDDVVFDGTSLAFSSVATGATGSRHAAPYVEPAMLQESRLNGSGSTAVELRRQVMATRLAQYAVNLIDYADADATMTPMVFDIDPFAIVFNVPDPPASPTLLPASSGWAELTSGYAVGYQTVMTQSSASIKNILESNDGVRGIATMARTRLIWGMERPDLLLTETMATHDWRVASYEDDGKTYWKQIRIPQGSTWFELYNTANPNQPVQPSDLYRDGGIDLAKMAGGGASPVWRIAISESTNPTGANTDTEKAGIKNSIPKRLAGITSTPATDSDAWPITSSTQSKQDCGGSAGIRSGSILGPSDTTAAPSEIYIDRIVLFTTATPSGTDISNTFWNRGGFVGTLNTNLGAASNTLIVPGAYTVIGPRMTTYLGSLDFTAGGGYGKPTGERVDLRHVVPSGMSPDTTNNYNAEFYTANGALSRPNVIIAATAPPTTWSNPISNATWLGKGQGGTDLYGIGLNVSEPLPAGGYYREPNLAHKNTTSTDFAIDANNYLIDGYLDLEGALGGWAVVLKNDANLKNPYFHTTDAGGAALANDPLKKDELVGEGTVPMYRTAMLQRVVDPNRVYDPVTNPYITVDWNMIDLTIFNGECTTSATSNPFTTSGTPGISSWTMHTTNYPKADSRAVSLASRQWGYTGVPTALRTLSMPNLWMRLFDANLIDKASTLAPTTNHSALNALAPDANDPYNIRNANLATAPIDFDGHAFKHRPLHTLGKLNWMYASNGVSAAKNAVGDEIGSVAMPRVDTSTAFSGYAPYNPPWGAAGPLPFLNLAWNDSPYANPYQAMNVPASAPGRFGMEFVDTEKENFVVNTPKSADPVVLKNKYGSDANDLFDVGSLGSGGRFGYPIAADPPQAGLGYLLNFFHTSLNAYEATPLPSTIYLAQNQSLNLGQFLDHVQVPSRFIGTKQWLDTGSDTTEPFAVSLYREPGRINVNTMSEPAFQAMMNDRDTLTPFTAFQASGQSLPFRSGAAGNLVDSSETATPPPGNATLLRWSASPLTPLLTPTTARNTTEELEGLQRLSNIATTRSNTFAVWITIGYFEVSNALGENGATNPATGNLYSDDLANPPSGMTADQIRERYNAIYPDGYQLGKELGEGDGGATRHRSFYIIDRTVPVGFRRGLDMNVENTIILKRNIE